MSLQPRRLPEVPADTARAAQAAFARGCVAIRIRDELGEVWSDQRFQGLYGVRGKPGISPAQLMIVLVLAMVENLTDRQAADMVRRAIDWKYALGLGLEDPGFDFTVLSEFRARLVAGAMETEALDLLLARLAELGLVRSGGRQRSDSTHVLARLRSLNRLELAGESIRAALEALAAAAPEWLATVIDAQWAGVYGSRIDDLHLPASDTKRATLALAYGRDGYRLLEAVYAVGAPAWLAELPAVEALRRIWMQQYYRVVDTTGEKVIRREASEQGLPPGRSKLVSPYDLDARYSEKRGTGWVGYKAHFTETCTTAAEDDPDTGRPPTPNLITNVATTQATEPDVVMTEPIHDSLDAKDLLPGEHVIDAGYTSADLLLAARARGVTLLGPLLADTSPQARTGGYTTAAFTIDWQARQVHCPQGATSTGWSPCTQRGTEAIVVKFDTATCQACPAKPRAPAQPGPDANCRCAPAPSTRPSNRPAPSRPPTTGTADTKSAPASRAPCARPPTSPASAAPAIWAYPRPPWNTTSPPQRSTSSATTPGSPAPPWTGPEPPTCNGSSQPQHDAQNLPTGSPHPGAMTTMQMSLTDDDVLALAADIGRAAAPFDPGHDRDATFVTEAYAEMAARGYLRLAVPAELGGLGATTRQVVLAEEELGSHSGAAALSAAMHLYLTLVQCWRRRRGAPDAEGVLRRIAEDGLVMATSGGSDWVCQTTVATEVDGGYSFDGRTGFCSQAPVATVMSTSAVLGTPGPDAVVLHAGVPLSAPGVRIVETWDTLGMRGTASHDVVFDGVFVPAEKIMGTRQYGALAGPLLVAAIHFAPVVAAAYLGVARGACREAVRRVACGPENQHRLAALRDEPTPAAVRQIGEMTARLWVARWALLAAVDEVGEDMAADHTTPRRRHDGQATRGDGGQGGRRHRTGGGRWSCLPPQLPAGARLP